VIEFSEIGVFRAFQMQALSNAMRGIHPLENGNILAVNFNAGVYVHNSSGARIGTVRTGFGLYGQANHATVCWADLALPYNVLDFSDVIAFLGAFSQGAAEADLAEPFGEHDFSDVLEFLALFGLGCP